MRIEITRTRIEDSGVFGEMSLDGRPFCVTCEQPWRDNRKGASCIPAGDYQLFPWDSRRFGSVLVFVNPALLVYARESDIPSEQNGIARSACLIHAANWPFQLQGCVAIGRDIREIPPHGLGVSHSRGTLGYLSNRWGDRNGHTATIRWSEGVF